MTDNKINLNFHPHPLGVNWYSYSFVEIFWSRSRGTISHFIIIFYFFSLNSWRIFLFFFSDRKFQLNIKKVYICFVSWIPYTKAPKRCELNCMPRGERFYYRHKLKVVDGTRCDDEKLDVCVDGQCLVSFFVKTILLIFFFLWHTKELISHGSVL